MYRTEEDYSLNKSWIFVNDHSALHLLNVKTVSCIFTYRKILQTINSRTNFEEVNVFGFSHCVVSEDIDGNSLTCHQFTYVLIQLTVVDTQTPDYGKCLKHRSASFLCDYSAKQFYIQTIGLLTIL